MRLNSTGNFITRLVRTDRYGHYPTSRNRGHIRGPGNPYALMQCDPVYDKSRRRFQSTWTLCQRKLSKVNFGTGRETPKNSRRTGAFSVFFSQLFLVLFARSICFRPVPSVDRRRVQYSTVQYSKKQPEGTPTGTVCCTVHVNLQCVRGQRTSIDRLCREP